MNYPTKIWTSCLCQQGTNRDNNEDSIFLRNYTNERYSILGVADGMGGLKMGEVASNDVCNLFNSIIEKHPENELKARADTANSLLYNRGEKQGATLSTIIIDKRDSLVFSLSIGDSRIYRYRGVNLTQLSTDDKPGHYLSPKNAITNAIGLRESIGILEVTTSEIKGRESWLLSTDGIHSFIERNTIKETIQLYKKQHVVCELTKQALNRGSSDDMSTIFCTIT